MSIQSLLAFLLGFSLTVLLVIPLMRLIWWRAVRLTEFRMRQGRPMNVLEAEGTTALIRARAAVEIEQLSIQLEKTRQHAYQQRIEREKMQVQLEKAQADNHSQDHKIHELQQKIAHLKASDKLLPAIEALAVDVAAKVWQAEEETTPDSPISQTLADSHQGLGKKIKERKAALGQ